MTLTYFFASNILVLILGYFTDTAIGDPGWRLHPVRVMGRVITLGETLLFRVYPKFLGGILLLLFTLALTAGLYIIVLMAAWKISPVLYIIIGATGVWTGISVKDMKTQMKPVCGALERGDTAGARRALAYLVSRDTAEMDETKIMSSAIETISENFTDAVMSPLFYTILGGGVGAVIFKAVSTLDSMVGYRNEKYARFGTASAVWDDILGFIPARLGIIPILCGVVFLRCSPGAVWNSYIRHRKDHKSPNSAHGIAAFAGALGVTLGGRTSYGGVVVDKPYIVGGEKPMSVKKIRTALSLYENSAFFAVLTVVLPAWLLSKISHVPF